MRKLHGPHWSQHFVSHMIWIPPLCVLAVAVPIAIVLLDSFRWSWPQRIFHIGLAVVVIGVAWNCRPIIDSLAQSFSEGADFAQKEQQRGH